MFITKSMNILTQDTLKTETVDHGTMESWNGLG